MLNTFTWVRRVFCLCGLEFPWKSPETYCWIVFNICLISALSLQNLFFLALLHAVEFFSCQKFELLFYETVDTEVNTLCCLWLWKACDPWVCGASGPQGWTGLKVFCCYHHAPSTIVFKFLWWPVGLWGQCHLQRCLFFSPFSALFLARDFLFVVLA